MCARVAEITPVARNTNKVKGLGDFIVLNRNSQKYNIYPPVLAFTNIHHFWWKSNFSDSCQYLVQNKRIFEKIAIQLSRNKHYANSTPALFFLIAEYQYKKQCWRIIEGVSMVCQGYTFFYVVLLFIGK